MSNDQSRLNSTKKTQIKKKHKRKKAKENELNVLIKQSFKVVY